jgi:hypothetical protein
MTTGEFENVPHKFRGEIAINEGKEQEKKRGESWKRKRG